MKTKQKTDKATAQGLVPKLRFPEFRNAGAWEEKRLKNISPAIFDGTHQTPTYTETGIPFFSVENIVSGNKNKYISREDYIAATSKNKPEKGDILITRIGNIGFSAVIDWDYEFSIYVTLAVIKKSELFNSHYLHSYLQSERYQSEILSKSLLNAVPCKINMDELRKTEILLPKPPEQQNIADCLSSIDELITAQSQKLDTLKAHKKGLMQQIFPAQGETVPKLHFPEFQDARAWEEKSLGQVVKFLDGQRRPIKESDRASMQGQYPYYGASGIIDYINDFIFDETLILLGEDGENIVSRNLPLVFKVSGKCWVNNHAHVLKPNKPHHLDFLVHYLESLSYIKYNSGGAQPKLNQAVCKTIPLLLPSPPEQQKIAGCLSSIDEVITAQAQKLDALKAHKKGLMQQLFPSGDEVTG